MAECRTLADLIKVYDNLPDYLKFDVDPEKSEDRMYENIFRQGEIRLLEAKNLRDVMRKFCHKRPEDEWTWENFQAENGEFIEDTNFHSYDFKREINLIKKGVYQVYDPEAVKTPKSEAEADSRENFDPSSPNADPVMISLYKALITANDETSSVEQSVDDKYNGLYETARNVASGVSLNPHAFICGEAGVGKSTTVEAGIKKGLEEWTPNKKHKTKPTFVSHSGSIGTSFTDLLIFFFQNRHNKLLLLDDADGFLVGTKQDIQNFMKVLLNSSLKPITTPRGIRKNANRQLEAELEESTPVKIKVDTSRLLEGVCTVEYDGNSFDYELSIEEAAKIKNTFGFKKHFREHKTYNPLQQLDKYLDNLNLFNEAEMTDEEQKAMDAIESAGKDLGLNNEELENDVEIPDEWIFDSNLVLISNLKITDIDEAVISRCDTYQLSLTVPEFFCRCEQILDYLKVGEYSSTDPEVIKWAKREGFAMLKSIVLGSKNFKNIFVPVNVHLDFRFVGNKVANKFLSRAVDYARTHNIDLKDPNVRPEVELGVRDGFVRDLLRLLKGPEN